MKNHSLFFCLILASIFVTSCSETTYVEPVSVEHMIADYLTDTLNIGKFNQDFNGECRILPVANEKGNLKFLLLFDYSTKIVKYDNGIETEYAPTAQRGTR